MASFASVMSRHLVEATGPTSFVLPLKQAGYLQWATIANCTLSAFSVSPCVTVVDSAQGVDQFFSIAVPLRTTMFVEVTSTSSLLDARVAFDELPSLEGAQGGASAVAKAFTTSLSNCAYSSRMLYLIVGVVSSNVTAADFDLAFYTAPVYDDQVRG